MKTIHEQDSAGNEVIILVPESLNSCIRTATEEYLRDYSPNNHPKYEEVEEKLLEMTNNCIGRYNYYIAGADKSRKLQKLKKLDPSQIADVMIRFNHIARLKCVNIDNVSTDDYIAIYRERDGVYRYDMDYIHILCRRVSYSITASELNEVDKKLKLSAPTKKRTQDPDLIPVNNGIFDYKKKVLMPFSPDLVFTYKSPVNYNPAATNVVIHNDDDNSDWDVESWMSELSDDSEEVILLWEMLNAVLRPFKSWNKTAWLYSDKGNNGKGSYCVLMRALVGEENVASLALADFSEKFATECVIGKCCIIADENPVGTYVDKGADKLKSFVTHDNVRLDIKFKSPVQYQFYGFIVQCLNEFPRIKDRSESLYRRSLFVPFTKCYTGSERKYIKDRYLHRKDVLEWVLFKVLNMNINELSEPKICSLALDDYRVFNDPVRQFMDEVFPELQWDLVPFGFLYDLYKSWSRRNNPSGTIEGKIKFISDVISNLRHYSDWCCPGRDSVIKTCDRMEKAEPLVKDFWLPKWDFGWFHIGTDYYAKPADGYRGLLRVGCGTDIDPTDETEDVSTEKGA